MNAPYIPHKNLLGGGGEIISTIRRLVFKPGCMGTHHIVRDEDYKGNILVSQTICDAFRREKIKGARIVTPDDYYRNLSLI